LFSYPVLALGLASPWLLNCGAKMPATPGLPDVPGAGAVPGCPSTASVEAIESFDFEKEFKLDAQAAGKVKAGLAGAVEIKAFSDKVDADLKVACGDLAKDLGAGGDFKSGEEACKAAIKAMGDAKGKMGANAKVALDIKPPACQASMSAMTDCAAKCDVSVKPGEAKVECEPGKLSGQCDAKCEGTCDLQAAAKCDGTCSGSCDAQMKGSCGGKCNGKCDGKPANGVVCNGTCDGKCDANVEGQCEGKCGGSCKLKAAAKCDGTCTGKCSAEFKAPRCSGEMKPPQMSADCKAKCDTEVTAKAECTPAHVGVKIEGATDAKAAEHYKLVLEKNLPAVLKVALGIGERGAKVAGQVKVVVEGLQGSLSTMVKGDTGGMTGAKLAACLSAPFKGAIDGAASLKANVNVSVDVKASASGSASASGKTG
jgi:hypothetical protein